VLLEQSRWNRLRRGQPEKGKINCAVNQSGFISVVSSDARLFISFHDLLDQMWLRTSGLSILQT
jgi:hypothetical protein